MDTHVYANPDGVSMLNIYIERQKLEALHAVHIHVHTQACLG